jgi:hypothetical protein
VKFGASLHCGSTARRMLSENTARRGTKAKPLSVGALAALLSLGADTGSKKRQAVTHITSEHATKGYGVVGRTGAFRQLAPPVRHPQKCLSQTCIVGGKGKAAGTHDWPGGFAVLRSHYRCPVDFDLDQEA